MGDAVAEAVMAQWAALPKTGKPQPHEHTVLAGIALELPAAGSSNGSSSSSDGPAAAGASGAAGQVLQGPQQAQQQQQVQLAVVAIATGTKCLGGSKRVPGGAAVNDCHAEALSRRALLRWLYGEMQQAAERCAAAAAGGASPAEAAAAASTAVLRLVPPTDGAAERLAASSAGLPSSADLGSPAGAAESAAPPTTDLFGGWRFQLQPGVRLHMYVSQPPCGDASILHAEGAKVAEGAVGAACQHGSAVCRSSGADAPAGAEADGQKAAADAAGAAAAAAGGRGLAASFGRTGAKPLLKRQRLQPAMDEQLGGQPQPSGSAEAGQLTQQAQDAQPAAIHQEQWRLPQQHEVESYGAAQETGVVRRKPGRGDATLSMSCSDKLARWLLLGLQGSLLDGLLAAPLHLASVTVNLPPPPAGTGQAAAAEAGDGRTSSRQDLAAQAAAALHRALVERTAVLAAERLPPARQPAAPALHIHSPAAAADEQAAGSGGGSSSSSGGSRMQALGLAPSASRRVAGGSSVVWVAPPLAGFKWKQQQLPADGSLAATAVAGSPAHSGTRSTTVPVLAGGATEAVAGGNGLKVGAAKVKPGQPVPPSAQPSVCKAALFRQWAQLAAALRSLLGSGKQAEALQAGQQPSSAADAAGEAAANAPAPVAAAYAGYSAVQSLSYRAAKRAAGGAYTAGWQALLAPPSPFEAWIPKPPELEEFAL